jgi:hypothetical protein
MSHHLAQASLYSLHNEENNKRERMKCWPFWLCQGKRRYASSFRRRGPDRVFLSFRILRRGCAYRNHSLNSELGPPFPLCVSFFQNNEGSYSFFTFTQCCGSGSAGTVCLGLLNSEPLVRGPDPDPSMTSKNSKKNLTIPYYFVTSF